MVDVLYEIDLERGDPEIVRTIKSLEFFIASVRARKGKIIKVWHGGEETRTRGKYKAPVRAAIRRLKREGRVNFYIYSENISEEDAMTRYMVEKYPLAKQEDYDFGNGFDCYTMICL